MNGIGLRTKLALGFGTLLTMLVLLGGVSYYSLRRVTAATEAANDSLTRKQYVILTEVEVGKQVQAANEHTFTGETASLQRYAEAKSDVQQTLHSLGDLLAFEKDQALFAALLKSVQQISTFTEQEIALRRANRNYEATDMAFGPKEKQAIKAVAADAAQLEAWEDTQARTALLLEHNAQSRANLVTVTLVLCGFATGILIATFIMRSITQGMSRMLGMIREIAANNLTQDDIVVHTTDEVGQAESALNGMKNNLRELINSIAATAEQVASATQQMSASAAQSAENTRVQSEQTQQVVAAMQEMAGKVQEVLSSSTTASTSSQRAADAAHRGGQVVEEALATIRSIADSSKGVAASITTLGSSSERISKIVGVIDDIADQTNLLALNAAIEAARAGEQGRGFAVVSDEVRKLAERTTKATKEIAATVESIQSETSNAVRAMDQGTRDVTAGVEKTSASGAALQEIITMSSKVGEVISEITSAANQQSDATQQVNHSMSQISSLVEESALTASQMASSCTDLSNLALNLRNLVNQFKLDSQSKDSRLNDSQHNDSQLNEPPSTFSGTVLPPTRSLALPRASGAAAGSE
jgi:methyl-accepting chemotaxis protein